MAHNRYLQPGGEDAAFRAEAALLRSHGHEVFEYVVDNEVIAGQPSVAVALQTIWSDRSHREIQRTIRNCRPDVAHFHNIFPLISPSAYYACREHDVPVVQTLHNFRLLCPVATFHRRGRVCEDCLGKRIAWPGIRYGCYHQSRLQTSVVATMLAVHWIMGTWQNQVNLFVALTGFSRNEFVRGGLPAGRIVVKPNFVFESAHQSAAEQGDYVLYLGRLSPEKGIAVLLEAWRSVGAIRLKIVGDGPLRPQVLSAAADNPFIEYLGYQDAAAIPSLMHGARFILAPSTCFENFPLSVIEGFAQGVPAIASRLGSLQEIVSDNRTGLLFYPGDPHDLATKVRWLWDRPEESARMGSYALGEYQQKYTPGRNYELLMGIYAQAAKAGLP